MRQVYRVLTFFNVVLAFEGMNRTDWRRRRSPTFWRRQPMRSMTQFLSTLRARATHGVEPDDSRIRRRFLAAAVATVAALALVAFAPGIVAKERRDDDRWVGTWSASPQAVAASIHLNGQTVR